MSSDPTQCMDICVYLFCVHVVLYVRRGVATGLSNVRGDLLTVFTLKKLKKRPNSSKQNSYKNENENVRYIGQGEARHRKYKRLKVGGGRV
jgi:hypothetical protein